MKRYIAAIMLVGALLISGAFAGQKKVEPRIQKAVVPFTEPVKLLNVILKGDYLFVHDEDKMAKGEPCTYIYAYEKGQQGKLILSFHCEPVPREATNSFTLIVVPVAGSDLSEIVEFRFANSADGHKVPTKS